MQSVLPCRSAAAVFEAAVSFVQQQFSMCASWTLCAAGTGAAS